MAWPPEDPELAHYRGPHLAVDVALLSVSHGETALDTLGFVAHRRGADAHGAGEWALLGRMVRERETLAEAVRSALEDKCGIHGITPRQLFVADDPGRDSRGWVMSVAHIASEPWAVMESVLDQRADLAFVSIARTPEISFTLPAGQSHLPYEQDAIVTEAITRLRGMYADRPDPGCFLPEEFTVYQLRHVHEAVLGRDLDKDVFRRQMLPFLEPTGRVSERTVGRPARLFRRA
jgi:ADP-ribose pyrophosphatase YjhB (NUDIX family)